MFFQKGATPRHIRTALGNALLLRDSLDADAVLFAAHDLVEPIDSGSVVYSDLWAINACSSRSFLPWSLNPTQYPFAGSDARSLEIDFQQAGEARLKRLSLCFTHGVLTSATSY